MFCNNWDWLQTPFCFCFHVCCIPLSKRCSGCSFFNLFLDFGTLHLENAMFYVNKTYSCLKSPFGKQIEKYIVTESLLAPFWHHFPSRVGIVFLIRFWMPCFWIWVENWSKNKNYRNAKFASFWPSFLHKQSHPRTKIHFGRHLGVPSPKKKHPFDLDMAISLGCGGNTSRI